MAGNTIYWISTALLSLLYLSSALTYVIKRDWVREVFGELGYPAYLMNPLIAVKILAVAVILSRIDVALSDLVYAGMLYHLLLSGLAHIGIRKPGGAVPAMLGLVLLAASFLTQNTAREIPSPYAPAAAAYQSPSN